MEPGSVEQRLLDEEEDRRETARQDEFAAKAAVDDREGGTGRGPCHARPGQGRSGRSRRGGEGQTRPTSTRRRRWESYTKITSPYNGVVIFRGEAVHPGAFIQSADKGMNEPMLTVAQDDRMRTVIPVPDRDVPFCDLGDPAIIHVDALNDREFKGTVSRIAESEDVNDRTMRVEVDLANRHICSATACTGGR